LDSRRAVSVRSCRLHTRVAADEGFRPGVDPSVSDVARPVCVFRGNPLALIAENLILRLRASTKSAPCLNPVPSRRVVERWHARARIWNIPCTDNVRNARDTFWPSYLDDSPFAQDDQPVSTSVFFALQESTVLWMALRVSPHHVFRISRLSLSKSPCAAKTLIFLPE